ncbi:MAG TPA: response regulator transcription factor [Candidatus Limnocylindria bacterium]|jgi:DNA-binding CsgD family transcriptional regulator
MTRAATARSGAGGAPLVTGVLAPGPVGIPAGPWIEALLTRLRLLSAAVAVASGILYPHISLLGAIGLGFGIVVAALLLDARARRVRDRRLIWSGVVVDLTAAVMLLLLSLPDPEVPAATLFPIVVFELVLRFGTPGIWAGSVALIGALGLRIAHRSLTLGLPPRTSMLVVFWITTSVFVLVGLLIRARERERVAAVAERQRVAEAFADAVREILTRTRVPREAIEWRSLDDLLAVGCSLTPDTSREIADALTRLLLPPPELRRLTPREREILELLRVGCSSQQIAERLCLSPGTVRVHISNVVHKLGVGGRVEAVRIAGGPNESRQPPSR